MDTNDIYFCIDIETNGPTPGHYSMLSFAIVAFTLDETIISTFERNLDLLPNAKEDPRTMQWWQTQPEAWQACRENPMPPEKAMHDLIDWVKEVTSTPHFSPEPFQDTDKKPVLIAHPTTFDHSFINWYLHEFIGHTPFYLSALDIVSYACATMKTPFKQSHRGHMPQSWTDGTPTHSHKAIDDAIGHAITFCRMVKANLSDKT